MPRYFDLTELEIAWLAGLLEGEGSFLRPPPSAPRQPRVCIHMTDEDVVQKVASMLGLQYLHLKDLNPGKWKRTYKLDIKGSRALKVMELVYPHMGKRRRERIDEILHMFKEQPIRTPKLTEAQARDILSLKGLHSAREVAGQFQLSIKTIEKIWKGSRWPQLQRDLNHPTQSNTGTS